MIKKIIIGIVIFLLASTLFLIFTPVTVSDIRSLFIETDEKPKTGNDRTVVEDHKISDSDFMAEVFVNGLNQPTTDYGCNLHLLRHEQYSLDFA